MIFPGLNLKYQYLKQYIHNIRKQLKRQRYGMRDKGNLSLRMALDKSDYYLKLIPKDKNNIFRVFSDSLYFTQSNYKQIKTEFYDFIQRNTNIFKNLLKFIGSKFESAEEYLEELNRSVKEAEMKNFNCGTNEITLTMLAFIFQRNLVLLYSDEDYAIKKYKLDLGFKESVFISILDNSGYFDTVYQKDHIKNCGLVQSVLFDLLDSFGKEDKENAETVSFKRNTLYK